jgi:hypothetical protein
MIEAFVMPCNFPPTASFKEIRAVLTIFVWQSQVPFSKRSISDRIPSVA